MRILKHKWLYCCEPSVYKKITEVLKVMGSNSARMVWPVVSLLKVWLLTAPTLWPSATYCSSRVSWLILPVRK